METTSTKHQKLSDVSPNMSSIDRISSLQDDLLCHILSFLPTKNSVATSVLSTRWRHLWAHVPNVDFDSELHTKGRIGMSTNFSDIIYRVMLMYKAQNINNFRLSYKVACGEYQLETCIATAILRNVKNLHLDLGNQLQLPSRIFIYKTLVELKLHNCRFISSSSFDDLYLPALKILYLASVMYESAKSLEHLIAGCPVLEELFIVRSAVDPLVCCYISSPTLHKLVLFTNFTNNGAFTLTYSVKIETPALRCLELQDTVSKDVSFGPLTFLVTAHVQFHNYTPSEGNVLYANSVIQLAQRLCKVKSLILCTSLLEVPESAFYGLMLKFPNLTSLSFYGDWHFIPIFLVVADNLEALTIHMVTNDLSCYRLPRLVPTCLTSRLKIVKMDQIRCTEFEFIMIEYLLKNAKVLKKMDIISIPQMGTDFKAKFEALNYISSFQRGSVECQVVFQ